MSSFLLQILADPVSGAPLESVNDEYYLNRENGIKYPIIQDVARLLPDSIIETRGAGVHASHGSNFDYRDHYEKDAALVDYFKEDEALVTRNERKRNRQAIIKEVPVDAQIILDIGCGGAWVAETFLPRGVKVISMDISSINPVRAKEKYPQSNHEAIVADGMSLPFKPNSIDCIISSEVIEHVPDPAKFLQSLLSKIKPGGRLILMTPYDEKIRYHLCVHCNKPTPQNGHLHSFSESKMTALAAAQNTEAETEAFCNKYFLKLRLYNLLSFLPFPAWKFIDDAANTLARKPLSLLTVIRKKS